MRLSTKVAYNIIIQITSKIISTILGLLVVAIMTRSLGKAGFGEYTTIITFLALFGIAIDFGLTLITSWMLSQKDADEKKIINNLFSLRFFTALIFLSIAPLVVIFFPYSDVVKMGVAITSISFFFISLNQIFVGFFQTKLRMDKVSIAEVVSRIVLFVGVFWMAKQGFGLLGFMSVVVIASVVSFLIQFIFLREFIKIKFAFDFAFWRYIIKKSWPFAVTIIFNLLYLKTDTLILSLVKSEEEVGVYGATYKVIEVLTMIPFMFAGIILPIITSSWSNGNLDFFKKVLQKSFDLMFIIIVPLVVGAQFLSESIMVIVAGEEFREAGSVLRVLIFAAGLVFVSCLLSHIVVAIGKQKEIIWTYVFTGVTSVIGYFIFIPKYSYFGAAYVTIYSELVITLLISFYIIKFTQFFPKFKVFSKVVLASLVMGIFLYFIPPAFYETIFNFVLVLLSSTIVYLLTLYVFKAVTREDINNLLNKEV